MQFANPAIMIWLWGIMILIGVFYFSARKNHQRLMKFTEEKLFPEVLPSFQPQRRLQKNILIVGVFFLSVIALARPQWGFEWREVKRQGIDILLLVDVSKSMLAADVKPNRLERTKLAIKDLVKKLQGDRIGLIPFAGDAFLACPLTVDYGGFLLALDDLNTSTIPRGGTDIGNAIETAIRGYGKGDSQYKAVVIVTDGDNLEGDPLAAARKAKDLGIKIYCIGIGSKEGELIQVLGGNGSNEFLKDKNGNFVKSRLNEPLLEKIALATGGVYVKASGAQFGLELIYDRELSKFEKKDFNEKKEKRYFERFQIPLSVAAFLLIIETCLTTRKKLQ